MNMTERPEDAMRRHLESKLAGLASIRMMALVDGAVVPLVVPLADWRDPAGEDIVAFDRAVTATGLRRFLRPMAPLEWRLAGSPPDGSTVILVEELAPGVRLRQARPLSVPTPRARSG